MYWEALGFIGRELGCTGRQWEGSGALGSNGMYWEALGHTGMGAGCTGGTGREVGAMGGNWDVLGGTRRHSEGIGGNWTELGCTGKELGCTGTGMYWNWDVLEALGRTGMAVGFTQAVPGALSCCGERICRPP